MQPKRAKELKMKRNAETATANAKARDLRDGFWRCKVIQKLHHKSNHIGLADLIWKVITHIYLDEITPEGCGLRKSQYSKLHMLKNYVLYTDGRLRQQDLGILDQLPTTILDQESVAEVLGIQRSNLSRFYVEMERRGYLYCKDRGRSSKGGKISNYFLTYPGFIEDFEHATGEKVPRTFADREEF